MIPYAREPLRYLAVGDRTIASFVGSECRNMDRATLRAFGEEWTRFSWFSEDDLRVAGAEYFDIVTPGMLGPEHVALDIGCGSGRWSKYIAGRVKFVESVDPSDAVFGAARMVVGCDNVRVTQAGFGSLPFAPGFFDFVLCLGVAHHVPDTDAALREAATMLKPGGHLLLYLYYDLDNRSPFYRALFRVANRVRQGISQLPQGSRFFVCDAIAIGVYLPLVGLARLVRALKPRGGVWRQVPLAYYADKSWRVMRNDALDRFGTPLEKRFSRQQIETMLRGGGLKDIVFSEQPPYWHGVARK